MERRYGFIHEKIDIKLLILYLLNSIEYGIDQTRLAEIITECDGGVGYFDFAQCLGELVETGHVENGQSGYVITPKGSRILGFSVNSLPYSVRIRADKLADRAIQELRRDAMISTSHSMKTRGGHMVRLELGDSVVGELLKIEIIAANEEQSRHMENTFRKNAEDIYLVISQMLKTGEKKS